MTRIRYTLNRNEIESHESVSMFTRPIDPNDNVIREFHIRVSFKDDKPLLEPLHMAMICDDSRKISKEYNLKPSQDTQVRVTFYLDGIDRDDTRLKPALNRFTQAFLQRYT